MLGAEKDYLRDDVIEMSRTERAGKSHLWMRVIPGAHQVDIAAAINLSAREEEDIDAALARTVEQLAGAISEEIVLAALQQGDVWAAATAFARQQCRRCRNWRGIADSDVSNVSDQSRDDVGEQLLVVETLVMRRGAHTRTA